MRDRTKKMDQIYVYICMYVCMYVSYTSTHLRQISGSQGGDKGSTERRRVRGHPLNCLSSLYVVVHWCWWRGGGERERKRERRERRGGRGKEGGRREGGGGKVRGLEGVFENVKGRICG